MLIFGSLVDFGLKTTYEAIFWPIGLRNPLIWPLQGVKIEFLKNRIFSRKITQEGLFMGLSPLLGPFRPKDSPRVGIFEIRRETKKFH